MLTTLLKPCATHMAIAPKVFPRAEPLIALQLLLPKKWMPNTKKVGCGCWMLLVVKESWLGKKPLGAFTYNIHLFSVNYRVFLKSQQQNLLSSICLHSQHLERLLPPCCTLWHLWGCLVGSRSTE